MYGDVSTLISHVNCGQWQQVTYPTIALFQLLLVGDGRDGRMSWSYDAGHVGRTRHLYSMWPLMWYNVVYLLSSSVIDAYLMMYTPGDTCHISMHYVKYTVNGKAVWWDVLILCSRFEVRPLMFLQYSACIDDSMWCLCLVVLMDSARMPQR
jgi:hypothetical protein